MNAQAIHRPWVLLILTCLVTLTSACSKGNLRPLEELKPPAGVADYRAGVGDALSVKVWGEPRVSGEVFIREDGKFTLPLVNDIVGAGKSLQEIADEITQKLAVFIPSATVSVSVLQSAPIRYYLVGSFLKPGEYRNDGRISLLQAIATGGGFAPFANESKVFLIRKGTEGEVRYELDYNKVIEGNEPNPNLNTGDVISVK